MREKNLTFEHYERKNNLAPVSTYPKQEARDSVQLSSLEFFPLWRPIFCWHKSFSQLFYRNQIIL